MEFKQKNYKNDKNFICTFKVVVKERISYREMDEKDPDWSSLIEFVDFFDEEKLKSIKEEVGVDETTEKIRNICNIKTPSLKNEVVEWLNSNCVYSISSISSNSFKPDQFNVFFEKKEDAMKFIKTFSIFKKPLVYFNYFSDEMKTLKETEIIKCLKKK